MPTQRYANQYSTDIILTTTVPSCGPVVQFGFEATYLRLSNDGGVPVRFSLASTNAASTDDAELRPGEIFAQDISPTVALALATTSTTTSTADDGNRVRVQAWGGF